MNTKYLECWKLTKKFPSPTGEFVAVIDFDLNVAKGEFVSIIGHSGCGKSTVLQMVAGLHTISGGALILDNKQIVDAGPERAVVFQSPNLLPWLSVFDNVLLGVNEVYSHLSRTRRAEIVNQYLELVGLADCRFKRPSEISQGMGQRVGLARAFALNPKILLLDEPFGMLDQLTRFELQIVLMDLCANSNKTAIMVTHDVDEAILLSDHIAMMTNGPAATLGKLLTVDLPRPRSRMTTMDHPNYRHIRDRMIAFLEEQDSRHAVSDTRANQELVETILSKPTH